MGAGGLRGGLLAHRSHMGIILCGNTHHEDQMGNSREYDAKLDSRNRLTIRDAGYEHYHVREFEDGRVVLEPRVLVVPNPVTAETLRDSEEGREVTAFTTAKELFEDLEG